MSSTSASSGISFSGLGSGIDTDSIVSQLMNIEKLPQDALKTKLSTRQNNVSIFQQLNTLFKTVRSTADDLNLGFQWKLNKAASSDSSVTATATGAAQAGALSFSVKNLASAQSMASFGTVASTSTVVGTGSALFGAAGSLGIGTMAGTGLTTGAHTLAVTQASAGANATGTAVADSVTLTGSETIQATVNGVARSYTLTAGTYNQRQLATMLGQVSNGELTAGVNSNKSLSVKTTREGSAASLAITGGTGLGALGLSTTGTVNGTNGVINVDGVANTVTNVDPRSSSPVTLNGSAGTVAVTFSGGLRTGSASVQNVSLGDGKLQTVVDNINAAGAGVTAAVVQVSANQYKLQLSSTTTGSAGAMSVDANAFAGTLGVLQTTQAAQDATITIGSGANAYDITSSSNTFSGVMPGVSLTASAADPTKTINVSVTGDGGALADKVQKIVDAANAALTYLKDNGSYDKTTGKAGPLLGNSSASRLQSQLFGALSNLLPSSTLGNAGGVGIKSTDTGTFTFDRATFLAAYTKDPEAVASAFVEGGTKGNTTLTKPGIAERLDTVGRNATDLVSGILTTAINGENSAIADLNNQIASWDNRLTKRQATLKAQFQAMETAVTGFKNTSNWLSGQISSLGK